MKLLMFWCVLLGCLGILTAATLKGDVTEKKKEDEDIYGDLDGSDLQKDSPPDPDYYEDGDESDREPAESESSNDVNVKILSQGEIFVKNKGETVTLPCRASSKDVVRVWKKELTQIFQDRISITNNENYNLTSDGDLQVTIESPEDYGQYQCLLAVYENPNLQVVHKVVPPTPPKITNLYVRENKKVFDVGDSFTVTCEASGYPKPIIRWYKDNNPLGTDGESLTISNAKPKNAGAYRCFADNKDSHPAHAYIEIQINHPPIVSVDKYLVNSDHGEDAELVCEVNAYPAASVVWQRNGMNIAAGTNRIQLKRERNNERNLLIIKGMTEKDFGSYTCEATNSLGKHAKKLNLVKTPAVREAETKQHHTDRKSKVLQWKVESKQPISKHELQYRRKGETDWKTINPEVEEADNDVYLIKHTLEDLEPGIYETRARSKNTHGWSDYSSIVPFEQESGTHHTSKLNHTKNESTENDTQDTQSIDSPAEHRTDEITLVGESTSGSTTWCSSLTLIVLALVTIHARQ